MTTYDHEPPTPPGYWRPELLRANQLLAVIAFLMAASLVVGIVLGLIAYDRVVDRLDTIKTTGHQIEENTQVVP